MLLGVVHLSRIKTEVAGKSFFAGSQVDIREKIRIVIIIIEMGKRLKFFLLGIMDIV